MAQLDDLAFFLRLAQCGSLTATARELGLSLSAVSKRLKQAADDDLIVMDGDSDDDDDMAFDLL